MGEIARANELLYANICKLDAGRPMARGGRGDEPSSFRSAQEARHGATSLRSFLQERWKGVYPILYGDQLRQARLDDWIFQGLLDVEHLPGETHDGLVARGETVPADGGAPDPAQVPEGGKQAQATAEELST